MEDQERTVGFRAHFVHTVTQVTAFALRARVVTVEVVGFRVHFVRTVVLRPDSPLKLRLGFQLTRAIELLERR